VQLLRIVVEDYVNHLSPVHFRLIVDGTWAERECWYRTNRINAEFNLLYRWHALVPDALATSHGTIAAADFMLNNAPLLTHGVENLIEAASCQRAGLISLLNTPDFLVEADLAAMDKSRGWRLRGYNDYRELYSLGRVQTFEEISSDPAIRSALEGLYGSVDDVEFLVGLLAEDRLAGSPLGETMSVMVGTDAFTQIYTNPLLSQNVYGAEAFSELGLRSIEGTETFAQLVERNCSSDPGVPHVSFSFDSTAALRGGGRPILRTLTDARTAV
jgi:prostaglandin-endoperoxide synthase 2